MLQQSGGISILLVANKHSCIQNVMHYTCILENVYSIMYV
jgi:hypothetical protein